MSKHDRLVYVRVPLPPMACMRNDSHVHAQPDPETASPNAALKYPANWLRAAVLGANDGLVYVASVMVGVRDVSCTAKEMVAAGLAGLVAGAFGKFLSVYWEYGGRSEASLDSDRSVNDINDEDIPSPMRAAAASALAFTAGASLPILGGGFISTCGVRMGVVSGVTSVGLFGFGAAAGYLGRASAMKSAVSVLVGGLFVLLVTYGM